MHTKHKRIPQRPSRVTFDTYLPPDKCQLQNAIFRLLKEGECYGVMDVSRSSYFWGDDFSRKMKCMNREKFYQYDMIRYIKKHWLG